MQRTHSLLVSIALLGNLVALPAGSVVLTAGDDYLQTPPGAASYDFANDPIPADFFFPGSDPFTGQLNLGGDPLPTVPAGALGEADTVVRRLADTSDLLVGGIDSVPIEIIALNLVSVDPITVTSGGPPTDYDVRVCVGPPQPPGSLDLTLDSPEGGSYDSTLPVVPKMIFTPIGGGSDLVLDCATAGTICDGLVLTNVGGPSHFTIGKDLAALGVTIPPPIFQVVTNCGATLVPSVSGSNFQVGLESTGPGPLDAICAPNTEAETALANNSGSHDAYLNDPNDLNMNGIPDFCEPPVPVPTGSFLSIAALILLLVGITALSIRQLGATARTL